jgi:prevent-host-death family protein
MITVGAFQAKTHLSSLLERVARGEEVTITKHGKPIARLIAVDKADQADVDRAVDGLRQFRKGKTLGGLSWKALRDEGRP